MEFKREKVELPGFKYPVVYVKELSILQLARMQGAKVDNQFDLFLKGIATSLVNEAGDKVITQEYTIDDFASEIPQSYVNALADAFAKLNGTDDDKALETAKN